jgi:hypothetical protein
VLFMLIGFPASDPASAGRRCHRYAVGQKRGRSNFMSTHQYKDMENQPSFAERTKQLKEIAFQLKNAVPCCLSCRAGRAGQPRAPCGGDNSEGCDSTIGLTLFKVALRLGHGICHMREANDRPARRRSEGV